MLKNYDKYEVIGLRRFHELRPGDKFKAIIHDIKPGMVTINLGKGEYHTARSLVLPEARIGEESLFAVRENDFEGRIVLEMVKLDSETKRNNMLTEALISADIPPTQELLVLGSKIMDSGLLVDSQTLQKAVYLNALFASLQKAEASGHFQHNADSVIFLLKELEVTQNLQKNISTHSMDVLREATKVFHLLMNQPKAMLNAIIAKDYKQVKTIKQFCSQIKNRRKYYQIPFAYKKTLQLAELHVFDKTSYLNSLLAIDTVSLGRIELLVKKANTSTQLEFRSDSKNTIQQLQQAMPQLLQKLQTSHFIPSFKGIDKPFTLLSPIPNATIAPPPPPPERFTFDMRV